MYLCMFIRYMAKGFEHLTITKLEAQICIECLCMLDYYNFLLLKPCAHGELHEHELQQIKSE